ncbi:MAG: C25 family cysteine peptidase [Bacteroidota bacterium]
MGKFIKLKKVKTIVQLTILTACLLFSVQGWSQNNAKTTVKVLENSSTKLRVQLKTGDYLAETIYRNKASFVRIAVEGLGSTNMAGYPELPQYLALINIPICDGFTYKVIKTNEVTTQLHTSGYPLYPVQPSRSKSDKSPIVFSQNKHIYQQNSFWNAGDAKVEKLGVMRNTTIARLSMSPFSYNPVTGEIKKVTSMDIEISFTNPNITATNNLIAKYDDIYAGNIQSTILNARSVEAKDAHVTGPLHYVIVSSPTFQTALQPLITWKKKKGYIVTEAYTNNAAVGTTTTTIKNYLKGLYDNATAALPAPTFVLFVGDIAQIPTFAGTTGTHPTDLYYCDWTGDYLPECYYGRFSGTTAAEITNQVSKTVEYEKYLMADPSFLNKMVIIAGQDATYGPTHGDGQLNYVKNNYFTTPPYTTYSYPYSISGSSAADIVSKVSAGVSIANYSAHGGSDGWSDPAFNVGNVATLTNSGKYPLMIGNCCLTNKFDDAVCFGEGLLRAQNKGAIGYIGASNSTYWNEDYYFACGYRTTVVLNSPYDATKLGAFDRLFHKNSEPYTAQYITSGQVLNAGNLAVTQSASSSAKYYWEIYHLMGDPSLMPYLGVPPVNTASFNPILPIGSTTIAVTTTPYSYVAVSLGTTLLGATFADASGVANVPLSGVSNPGTADLVITAQNKQPFFGTINIQTPTGAYVWLQTEATIDASGNNNGLIDYNENAGLSVTLKNFGAVTANAVQAKLTTTSQYITMTDSLEVYGNITADQSVLKTNAFAFHVANNVPDGEQITFNLTITDNASHTWATTILKTVNAPKFEIYSMTINDATGNNNSRLDAGETVQITFTGKNIGHAATTTTLGTLTTNTPGITITNSPSSIGAVAVNGNANATIQVAVASSVPNPTVVNLTYRLSEGAYFAEMLFTPTTGLVSEDYETGNFTRFSWNSSGGNAPWTIVNAGQYEGTYCSKSGAITNNQSSVMQITMNVIANDSISFYRKVSCEDTYDFLRFYIDGTQQAEWTGEQAWQRVAYPVATGSHTFKWSYEKDYSTTGGSDCSWVDYVLFPPVSNTVDLNSMNKEVNNLVLFPNPTSDNLNIAYLLADNQTVTIQIFDGNGRLVNTLTENEMQLQGTNATILNTSSLGSGLYFITIKTDKTVITQRFSVIK